MENLTTHTQVYQNIKILAISMIFTSHYLLLLMSIDRLIYLRWPLHYKKRVTCLKSYCAICLVLTLCIVFAAFPAFGIEGIIFLYLVSDCSVYVRGGILLPNIYYSLILCFVAGILFVTATIANIWVVVIIHRNYGLKHSKSVDTN